MSRSFEIELGEPVFCTELNTGDGHSGNFLYSEEGIVTTLTSFNGFFYVKADLPVYLLTEKLQTVSLHDNLSGPPGTRTRFTEPVKQSHTQRIRSNSAIVGNDEWRPEDRVKRVSFQIAHSMELLRNEQKVDRLSNLSDKDGGDDHLLLNLKAAGTTVRLHYDASYSLWGKEPIDINPRFELEFDKAVPLGGHREPMQRVLSFCSLALGVPLRPSDIRISRQSHQDYMSDVENKCNPSEHRVLYHWSKSRIDPSEIRIHGSPFLAFDDIELKALSDCLAVWLERGEEWSSSYALMMGCLSRRNQASAERLLNACKWLEELPNASEQSVLDNEVFTRIVRAAQECAKACGYDSLRARIGGGLRSIKLEDGDQRFRRLIGLAWNGYTVPKPPEDMVNDLKRSQKIRGKVAHGYLDFSSSNDAMELSRVTGAVEALCFMLTVRDLPLSDEGRERFPRYRIIEDYEMSW